MMQTMLIKMPMGPRLIFDEGLKPNVRSVFFERLSSISPMGFTRTDGLTSLFCFSAN
ncbi:MAG: hypothetical protein QF746_02120 [Candidatus Thalassarchaeaceae archaeon]|nr:hypothetical protein [Candidatus Thalassarchaeaceae archaeon]